jgi:hypothetical protein
MSHDKAHEVSVLYLLPLRLSVGAALLFSAASKISACSPSPPQRGQSPFRTLTSKGVRALFHTFPSKRGQSSFHNCASEKAQSFFRTFIAKRSQSPFHASALKGL